MRTHKLDESFICRHCGNKVEPLGYTSRDHCNNCLYSLHVDILPGDRANTCHGLLKPINIFTKKENYVIEYVCQKCGESHNNKGATDDNFEMMLKIMKDRK
jgi:DNA-directed RNA polymerase subunit RPC12/RpoP